ncbi:unnamed protein product [Thlaspi arvense]|uniref:RING-type E3 ubiquitin transferase n=1 Tax=Thlaspi arvense TaxID=13288 RepID=A0AAU9ST18_THLAR|nr:unnamed protein product [Thlaspi arvense]
MVWYLDVEPASYVSFDLVRSEDQHNNKNFVFDFELVYRLVPEPDSDSDPDEYLDVSDRETRIIHQTYEFDRAWLIGGDRDQIQATIFQILEMIQVPSYRDIVHTLTLDFLDLKKREAMTDSPKVDRVRVEIDVVVYRFPGNDDDDVEVKFSVAPASDDAVEKHFETVVVGNDDEGDCMICMDTIRGGSGVAAGRMPCSHVFHRKCGEEWLRSSGICPVCRAVFPPL